MSERRIEQPRLVAEHHEHEGIRREVASQVDRVGARSHEGGDKTDPGKPAGKSEPTHVDFSKDDIYNPNSSNAQKGFSGPNWGLDSKHFTDRKSHPEGEKPKQAEPNEATKPNQVPGNHFDKDWHHPAWGLDPSHFTKTQDNSEHSLKPGEKPGEKQTQPAESSGPAGTPAATDSPAARSKAPSLVKYSADQLDNDATADGRNVGNASKVGQVAGAAADKLGKSVDALSRSGTVLKGAGALAKGLGRFSGLGDALQIASAAQKAASGDYAGATQDGGRVVATRVGGFLGGAAASETGFGVVPAAVGGSYIAGKLYDAAADGNNPLEGVDW